MYETELPSPPSGLLGQATLFLDFDGTLVELADRPDAVVVDAALARLLARLRGRLDGRLGVISGRSIAQLDQLLGTALSGIAVVGSHGTEIRTSEGPIKRPERPAAIAEAEQAFAERFAATSGVIIEVKTLGVAIHYRLAPEIEAEADALVAEYADRHGLLLQKGKMMRELRMAGHDKGSAVLTLMQGPPFAGHRPIFAGDDVTDEAAFIACERVGGGGILIGPARATAASWRLPGVRALRTWLEAAA